jgi:nitrate reductase NapAB chaperone NapD
MTIIGALVHSEPALMQTVQNDLSVLDGISVHPLMVPGQMAVVVEAENINQAHSVLTDTIENTEGVMAVYPVYTYLGEVSDDEGGKDSGINPS